MTDSLLDIIKKTKERFDRPFDGNAVVKASQAQERFTRDFLHGQHPEHLEASAEDDAAEAVVWLGDQALEVVGKKYLKLPVESRKPAFIKAKKSSICHEVEAIVEEALNGWRIEGDMAYKELEPMTKQIDSMNADEYRKFAAKTLVPYLFRDVDLESMGPRIVSLPAATLEVMKREFNTRGQNI